MSGPTFLQLPPEMGGTRFGPFPGMLQLGSDPSRCQVVVPTNLGAYPVHAVLGPTGPRQYTLAPSQHGAATFLVKAGTQQFWPVQGPVSVSVGDAIVIGSPAGPRFYVLDQAAIQGNAPGGIQGPMASAPGMGGAGLAASAAAAGGGLFSGITRTLDGMFGIGGGNMGGGIANELARQQRARLLTKSPYREIYFFYSRFRSGQLFSPVVLVGVFTAIVGAIAAGGMSCTGLLSAVYYQLRYY